MKIEKNPVSQFIGFVPLASCHELQVCNERLMTLAPCDSYWLPCVRFAQKRGRTNADPNSLYHPIPQYSDHLRRTKYVSQANWLAKAVVQCKEDEQRVILITTGTLIVMFEVSSIMHANNDLSDYVQFDLSPDDIA